MLSHFYLTYTIIAYLDMNVELASSSMCYAPQASTEAMASIPASYEQFANLEELIVRLMLGQARGAKRLSHILISTVFSPTFSNIRPLATRGRMPRLSVHSLALLLVEPW